MTNEILDTTLRGASSDDDFYVPDGLRELEALANNEALATISETLGSTTFEALAQEIFIDPATKIRAGKGGTKPKKTSHKTNLGGERWKQDTD